MYQAIFWHTTAKADMTLLEKIIYIADYIEPNRDFEGVEELRRLAYEDLDRALLLGVETTIQEMRDRPAPHPHQYPPGPGLAERARDKNRGMTRGTSR